MALVGSALGARRLTGSGERQEKSLLSTFPFNADQDSQVSPATLPFNSHVDFPYFSC